MEKNDFKELEQRAQKDGLFVDYTPVAGMPGYAAVMATVSDKMGKRVVRTGEAFTETFPLKTAFEAAGTAALCAYYGIAYEPAMPAAHSRQPEQSSASSRNAGNTFSGAHNENNRSQSKDDAEKKAAAAAATTANRASGPAAPNGSDNSTGKNGNRDTSNASADTNTAAAAAAAAVPSGTAGWQQGGNVKNQAEPARENNASADAHPAQENAAPSSGTTHSSGKTEQGSENTSSQETARPADDFKFEKISALKGRWCSDVCQNKANRNVLKQILSYGVSGKANPVIVEEIRSLNAFIEAHKNDIAAELVGAMGGGK